MFADFRILEKQSSSARGQSVIRVAGEVTQGLRARSLVDLDDQNKAAILARVMIEYAIAKKTLDNCSAVVQLCGSYLFLEHDLGCLVGRTFKISWGFHPDIGTEIP